MLVKQHLGRIAARAVAGIAAVAALASCGGGTYQVSAFVPARILTFGDESSMLVSKQGLKYSVNALSTSTNQVDCSLQPLWTQTLANSYGLVYTNCNVNAAAETNAIDLTTLNGTVEDVVTQVAAFQALDTFNSNDLVTIWVGVHDVVNDYQSNGTGDQPTLISDMKASGQTLGNLVNAITSAGAKVILLTIPDLSYSPFGFAEAQRGDFDRAQLLSDMSTAFNVGMRSTIINDGSKIGLVLVDDFVRNATRNPGSYSLISLPNQTYACLDTAPLPSCDDDTLNTDPTTNTTPVTAKFLWADDLHLAPTGQLQIGNQAVGRAHSNPF